LNPMINQTYNPMYTMLNSEQQRIQLEEKAYREAKAAIQFAKHKFEALPPQQQQKMLNEMIEEFKREYVFNYLNYSRQNRIRQNYNG